MRFNVSATIKVKMIKRKQQAATTRQAVSMRMIHYSIDVAVGQENCVLELLWQVVLLSCSSMASLTDLNLYDILVKDSEVQHIDNFHINFGGITMIIPVLTTITWCMDYTIVLPFEITVSA